MSDAPKKLEIWQEKQIEMLQDMLAYARAGQIKELGIAALVDDGGEDGMITMTRTEGEPGHGLRTIGMLEYSAHVAKQRYYEGPDYDAPVAGEPVGGDPVPMRLAVVEKDETDGAPT